MSKQEQLMYEGWVAEKKRRIHTLEEQLKGAIPTVRTALPPFGDLDLINARLAFECCQLIFNCDQERKDLLAELQAAEKDWDSRK